jgi:hypothetical protein
MRQPQHFSGLLRFARNDGENTAHRCPYRVSSYAYPSSAELPAK